MMFALKNSSDHRSSKHNTGFFLLSLLAIALLGTIIIGVAFPSLKYEYEEKLGGAIWSMFPEQEKEKRITIVAIDENSLAKVGAWPWPRETIAELSNRIAEYGSTLQLFDIVFPEEKTGDYYLSKALINNKGIISQIPILDKNTSVRSGTLKGELSGERCQFPIPQTSSYLANTPSLTVTKVGHISPIVDQDGVIRKQPPIICIDGQLYPSLALQGLLNSLSNQAKVAIRQQGSLVQSKWELTIDSYFGLSIPVDNEGNMRLSYRQSPDVFQVVSAASILDGTAPKNLFDNTWALIGATAFGLGDVVPTPHSGATPGVELQARFLSNLLDGRTPYTPVFANYLLWLEGLIFSVVLIILSKANSRPSTLILSSAVVIMPASAWALHSYLLSFDIWLGWLNVALYSFIASSLFVLADHQLVRYQHLRLFNYLSSYLPKPVAQALISSAPSGAVEAKRQDLVLLCADLRNFSSFEESRPPEEAAALLHTFFTEASRIIESSHGQIEEYKGDSLLASWNLAEQNNASSLALSAAFALQESMFNLLPSRPPKGLEPLALGVGIERGSTLVGSIGPIHRRHHTLLGDTVTIVLRIQEMTQDLAQPILVGECAARDLYGDKLESQGSYLLDGLTTPHVLFAPKTHRVDPLAPKELGRVIKLKNAL